MFSGLIDTPVFGSPASNRSVLLACPSAPAMQLCPMDCDSSLSYSETGAQISAQASSFHKLLDHFSPHFDK